MTTIFFSFCDCKIKCLGACDIPLERYFEDLSNGKFTSPGIPKLSVGKSRKTNLQLFSYCIAWWSKEPQWENNCGSFLPFFLLMSVKWTWTVSAFSTNERSRNATITSLQSLVWRGPKICVSHVDCIILHDSLCSTKWHIIVQHPF